MIEKGKQQEKDYYNAVSGLRTTFGGIPVEADIRTTSLVIPSEREGVVIDAGLTNILLNGVIDQIVKRIDGYQCKILDVCCGMGWLSLELARNGHHVDAYDLSDRSISFAKNIKKIHQDSVGFGSINYHNEDITKKKFRSEEYDVIIGWSAFHHLPQVEEFLEACATGLKKNGVIITYDDIARQKVESFLENALRFILPQIGYSYREKLNILLSLARLKKMLNQDSDSPMERIASKSSSVELIDKYFKRNFIIEQYITKNAFCGTVLMRMPRMPLRYAFARVLNAVDNLLITMKLVSGFDRIIIARKRHEEITD